MKNITFRYSLTQFTYWAASTGASSFATTCLLKNGLSTGLTGALLALSGILSRILQPVLAKIADKSNAFRLPHLLAGLSMACAGCFAVQLIPNLSSMGLGICYMAGIFLSNMMLPLINALCISYAWSGYAVNYGIARGIGSAASAISSLVLGYVIAQAGGRQMILLLIAFRCLNIVILLGYPPLEKAAYPDEKAKQSTAAKTFFSRYPWYCATLLGVMFLGMYHAMTENYMIAIMEHLGGNSSHVGIALFISSMAGAPVIFCSQKIQQKITDATLLKIAAGTFLLKSILISCAGSIPTIYCIQLLQMTSYAFLEPTLVYYAGESVCCRDMVAGQAFSTAAYALGCSAGNMAGGQLLAYSINTFFISGIVMALAGVLIIFATVSKRDSILPENAS